MASPLVTSPVLQTGAKAAPESRRFGGPQVLFASLDPEALCAISHGSLCQSRQESPTAKNGVVPPELESTTPTSPRPECLAMRPTGTPTKGLGARLSRRSLNRHQPMDVDCWIVCPETLTSELFSKLSLR
jgi:hypothetical protein